MPYDAHAAEVDFTKVRDERTELFDFIGGPPWQRTSVIPDLDATIDEVEESRIFADLDDRGAYLEWVQAYKAFTRSAEVHIRNLKSLRKHPSDDIRSTAQFAERVASDAVTIAIRMRRIGKRWSWDRKIRG